LPPLMEEMQKGTTVLRVHMTCSCPPWLRCLQRMPAGGNPSGASSDPNEPFMQMNQEVAELSAAPVPDSVFPDSRRLPGGAASDLIKPCSRKARRRPKQ